MAEVYRSRRDALCDGLAEAGWDVPRPCGTMFVWARLPTPVRADGSLAFAGQLLREAHVAVSPGVGFTGPSSLDADHDDGERRPAAPVDESSGRSAVSADEFVRFALVQPEERLREACRRIGRVLQARSG